jgi:RimJ/RimL family protein N-acetyltransferase
MIIKTKRFIIRNFKLSYVNKSYFNWFKDKTVKKFILFKCRNINELKLDVIKRIENRKNIFFAIFYKKIHIGNFFFHDLDYKKKSACIGILIGKRKWRGKGVGYEIIKKMIYWVFKKKKITKLFLGVNKNNKIALKLYQKLNFQIIKNKKNILMMKKIGRNNHFN